MFKNNKGIVEIHIAVLLFGFAGLFGKLISQSSMVIVFGRVLSAALFLFFYLKASHQTLLPKNRKDCFFFICLGALLAIHWISYFKSIQLSTVAIGLLTFSTFPVFVTFLEPCFLRSKIELKDIIISLITFLGIALVIPKFQFNNNMTQGALWGIFSGFTFAILSILNKKNTKEYSGLLITFYETAVSTVLLIPFMLVSKPIFNSKDILLLIVLGVVFTGISHSLFVSGMSTVKAQTASIISTLEPVYGIISTAILFGEIPTPKVIVGGLIILGTSIYSSIN